MLLALFLVFLVWLFAKSREGFEVHIKSDLGDYGQVVSKMRSTAGRVFTGLTMVPERFVSYLPFRGHIRRFRRNLSL
jgi:hypothetical protein